MRPDTPLSWMRLSCRKDRKESQVLQVRGDFKGHRVYRALPECRGLRELQEYRAQLAPPVQWGPLDRQAQLGQQVLTGRV